MHNMELLQTVLGLSGILFLMIGAFRLKYHLKKYVI